MSANVAYLALGSNLGDRAAHIQSAIEHLRRINGVEVQADSSMIETAPVGLPNQGPYLNAAVKVMTTLPPRQLLQACLHIEQAHGRDRRQQQRWGPRTLDIDVLLYGDAIIDDPGPPRLRIPHPHMTEREFVLRPLAQIAADVVHPIARLTIGELLRRLHSPAVAE